MTLPPASHYGEENNRVKFDVCTPTSCGGIAANAHTCRQNSTLYIRLECSAGVAPSDVEVKNISSARCVGFT